MRTSVPTVRAIVLACLLGVLIIPASAQSISTANGKIELGLGIGPSVFLGDLGGNRGIGTTFIKDVNLPLTKLMKGLYLNFYPTEWLGFRLSANSGEIEAFDSIIGTKGKAETYRKQRNLDFRSKIQEIYFAAEIYPTVILEEDDALLNKFRPYGLAGFGLFHFNPQGIYIAPDGSRRWVDLRPLRLEGQGMTQYPNRKEYPLTQSEMVMGGGFKYYITESMYIGFEILHRKTFTDYVDDVSTKYIDPYLFSVYLTPDQAVIARQLAYREKLYDPTITRPYIGLQRGDPKQNDAFFSGLLRFGWRLSGPNTAGRRAGRQLKCPVFY